MVGSCSGWRQSRRKTLRRPNLCAQWAALSMSWRHRLRTRSELDRCARSGPDMFDGRGFDASPFRQCFHWRSAAECFQRFWRSRCLRHYPRFHFRSRLWWRAFYGMVPNTHSRVALDGVVIDGSCSPALCAMLFFLHFTSQHGSARVSNGVVMRWTVPQKEQATSKVTAGERPFERRHHRIAAVDALAAVL